MTRRADRTYREDCPTGDLNDPRGWHIGTIDELMHANLLQVFNEHDDERRRAVADRIYAEDIKWTDDEGITVGREALDAKAIQLLEKMGGLRFVAAGPVHHTTGLGQLAFRLIDPESGAHIAAGFDVALIRDGRIAELYTVLTDDPDS